VWRRPPNRLTSHRRLRERHRRRCCSYNDGGLDGPTHHDLRCVVSSWLGTSTEATPARRASRPVSPDRDQRSGAVRSPGVHRMQNRRGGDKRLEVCRSSRSFRGFSRTSPVRVIPHRAERRKVAGPRRSKSTACACGSTTGVSTVSTARWGMNSGPSHATGSPPSPEPELPGEFVSDELRSDCARFMNELRGLVRLRSELPPKSTAWMPSRSEGQCRPAGQSPPNSRSAQPGQ
jgi:hypothetical protein